MPWIDRLVADDPRIPPGSPAAYVLAIALAALGVVARVALDPILTGVQFITLVPVVIVVALVGGLGPGLLAVALGTIGAWFAIFAPTYSFAIHSGADAASLLFFAGVGVFICGITHALRTAVAQLRVERRRLEELSRTLEHRVTERTAELAAANDSLRAEIEAREQAEASLRQVQKMEAVGQLTGGIAHDFNNLLTPILGNVTSLLERMGDADARTHRQLDAMRQAAERAAVLTQRLLAFARRQPLSPSVLDVNKLVADTGEMLRRTLGEAIEVETVLAGGLWRAQADANQLENALLNLAVNARDAMPGGGKLTIETANTHLDEIYAAAHAEVTPGQYVLVAVTDTGAGMPPDVQARAFEPFFTTKGVGQGTGLGLSMVYGFVRQSGGHVKIYSEPGQGTTVKLYLPRAMAGALPLTEVAAPTPAAAPAGGATVVVVEDEDLVRAFMVETLRRIGYTVHEAADGPAALALFARLPTVDLLLTDVGLPGMNGRQLAEAIQAERPGLKVLFVSGYTRNAIVHNGTLDPGVMLLSKPFTAQMLAMKAAEAMETGLVGVRE
ncbi:ATP-binding protein [Azospirillum sp.]|uniref:ATP-binding protein n=1 Tax=Azospirillum sp. TaxID=34012 RepID=UPI002D50610A|nr:ATP-binding protein [Azospirillum sp.]HYD64350.1 ATP-binding protein [Azospirillum sp.]